MQHQNESSDLTIARESCLKLQTFLLPIFDESKWSPPVRAVLYFVALLFMFVGIFVGTGVFMEAIEQIIFTKMRIPVWCIPNELANKHHDRPRSRKVRVWNLTVANLMLMALATSAPEILFALVDVLGHGFKMTDLGPGTIIGSAAFNQMMIPAACVLAVPNGQAKKIQHVLVYAITTAFSIFAYLWILLVMLVITPGTIEVWEALATLTFFFVFIIVSYIADRVSSDDNVVQPISVGHEEPADNQNSESIELDETTVIEPANGQLTANASTQYLMEMGESVSPKIAESIWHRWKKQIFAATVAHAHPVTWCEYLLHVVSLFWKVCFSFLVPRTAFGGYVTFVLALLIIGLQTAIVSDIATVFGCLIGMRDMVTGVTFLAVGTSMPDTFASRIAAIREPTADDAIGNVNGSNAVLVFLGLGLPWTCATLYWHTRGETFQIRAEMIGYNVVLYLILSMSCALILLARRRLRFFGNAELGGPFGPKVVSVVVLTTVWLAYVLLASMQVYGYIRSFFHVHVDRN